MLANTLDTKYIVLIVVGSVLVLIGLGVLLYFLIFVKSKMKKQVRELDRKFQYLHALLIGQDAQYVKRLEIISRTNLLYVDTHTKFLKRFKEIRDKHDTRSQSSINKLKDLIDDSKYKQVKSCFNDVKDIILHYEREVTELNNDLLQVVKPEEECRQSSLNLKEELRNVKQEYYAKQGDLSLVEESFTSIFEYIDKLFEEFEDNVESAQYDDANNILPKVGQILHEIESAMVELPSLCALAVNIIPDKIISLENATEVMIKDEFPLHHLGVQSSIKDLKSKLDALIRRIKEFSLHHVREELDNIVSRIDEFLKLFEEERVARDVFEKDNEEVYRTVTNIERRFIKLCNTLPEVSTVFVINEIHKNKINEIQGEINKVGAFKRSLDTFIHSATKQPYSLLVNKLNELSSSSKTIITELDEFNSYLVSLKNDSEFAYNLIYSSFEKVKNAEKEVKDMMVDKISEKYAPVFERFYMLMNKISDALGSTPIDVEVVNELVIELQELSNESLENGSISQDYNLMLLAQTAIIYANRDRNHLGDINEAVQQAEMFYENGEFEQAYVVAGNALKKLHASDEA